MKKNRVHTRELREDPSLGRKRSERARVAAKYRHNNWNHVSKNHNMTEGGAHREVVREKNRIAAAKCRNKKRAAMDELNQEYRAASAVNSYMKRQEHQLRDQLTYWRMLALQHQKGRSGCQCAAIQHYNTNQLYTFVLGVENAVTELGSAWTELERSPDGLRQTLSSSASQADNYAVLNDT